MRDCYVPTAFPDWTAIPLKTLEISALNNNDLFWNYLIKFQDSIFFALLSTVRVRYLLRAKRYGGLQKTLSLWCSPARWLRMSMLWGSCSNLSFLEYTGWFKNEFYWLYSRGQYLPHLLNMDQLQPFWRKRHEAPFTGLELAHLKTPCVLFSVWFCKQTTFTLTKLTRCIDWNSGRYSLSFLFLFF